MRYPLILATAALGLIGSAAAQADDLKIGLIYGKTGPLEAYAKQTETGLRMGLEYATKGTMTLDGRKIVIITKDDQSKPDLSKAALAEAYQDDKVDIAIGTTSSAAALADLPVAEENKKILIVEPAVADQITGEKWNRYIFRTGRNSSQDAISNAVAIGKPGVTIATLAQDYAFGRDGVAAFKEALAKTGATLAAEEYAPTTTTDFTAAGQRLFDALKDKPGRKIIWVIWAGAGNPLGKLQDMDPKRYGIELSTGGNILPALAAYKSLPGMEGATYYYYDIPKNPVNDWLVAEHQKRFNAPPDFFTAGGFAAAMAVVAAVTKAKSTDTEKLISGMEGMEFDTPKGKMIFRKEDHQALQSMYHFKVKVDPNLAWAVNEAGPRDQDRGHEHSDPQQAVVFFPRLAPPCVGRDEAHRVSPEFPMTLLETRDLTIRFGGHVAVNNVSCTFRPGELTAIVGPNGAGKTTYFNLISGQLRPSGGSILFDGADITPLSRAAAHPRRPRPRFPAHQPVPQSERGRECPARRAVRQRRALRHAAAVDDAHGPDRPRRRHSRQGGARQPAQRGGDRAVPWRSAQARSRADDGARAEGLHVRRTDRRHEHRRGAGRAQSDRAG